MSIFLLDHSLRAFIEVEIEVEIGVCSCGFINRLVACVDLASSPGRGEKRPGI